MKRFLIAAVLLAGVSAPAFAQPSLAVATGDLHILPVQGNIYMLVGAGSNITLSIGPDGVMLVNSGLPQYADKVVAEIRKLTDKPIRYIINTSADADDTGGNEAIGKLGGTIAGGNVGAGAGIGAAIVSHENVLNRMSAPTGSTASAPVGAWPTETFFTKKREMYFNGEPVEILYQPNAHTDGDVMVFFRHSDVIAAGNVFLTTTFPMVDAAKGGTINGELAALNNIIDITVPRDKEEGGTYVIPGHGRLCDEADVVEFRDMATILRDRFQDLVKRGKTLADVKALNPLLDYEARYGSKTAPWTSDAFIDTVYNDLSKNLSKELSAKTPAKAPVKKK